VVFSNGCLGHEWSDMMEKVGCGCIWKVFMLKGNDDDFVGWLMVGSGLVGEVHVIEVA